METKKLEEYIAPDINLIEIIVEQGFAITGIVINKRYGVGVEEHIVDDVQEW